MRALCDLGDRHPGTGSPYFGSPVSRWRLCLLFFPDSWDDYARWIGVCTLSPCATVFCLYVMLYSVEPVVISFGLFLVGLLCCFPLLLFAWTRTSLLAGESEVVLSGVDRL